MDTLALTKWIIWCAIATLVCAGILVTIYLWHTWPAPSGPGVASTTAQEQAPASPATLNTSDQELQQSEVQAQRANPSGNASAGSSAATQAQLQASQKALEQAQRANPSASAGPSAATQAQLQASQNALEQVEAQQKVQEQ
jgi:hypothetical protein